LSSSVVAFSVALVGPESVQARVPDEGIAHDSRRRTTRLTSA
jgi:hypothetical protein